jgi:hypothetical protein
MAPVSEISSLVSAELEEARIICKESINFQRQMRGALDLMHGPNNFNRE